MTSNLLRVIVAGLVIGGAMSIGVANAGTPFRHDGHDPRGGT